MKKTVARAAAVVLAAVCLGTCGLFTSNWVRNVDAIAACHPVEYVGRDIVSGDEHWIMSDGSHAWVARGVEP